MVRVRHLRGEQWLRHATLHESREAKSLSANGPQPQVIQRLADQAADRFPDTILESLAVDLDTDAVEHPETGEMANAIAFELRLRAAVGVRKWPTPANVENDADELIRKLTVEIDTILSGAELTDADLLASAYGQVAGAGHKVTLRGDTGHIGPGDGATTPKPSGKRERLVR